MPIPAPGWLPVSLVSRGVGPEVPVESVVEIPFVPAKLEENEVSGTIDVLDVRFGSLWTNIPRELFLKMGVSYGERIEVIIEKRDILFTVPP